MTRLFSTCIVERRILGTTTHFTVKEPISGYRIAPHNVPLVTSREKRTGVCDSCFSGWTHPDNAPTPKGEAQIAAARSEAGRQLSALRKRNQKVTS